MFPLLLLLLLLLYSFLPGETILFDVNVRVFMNNSRNKTNKRNNVKIMFFYTQFVITPTGIDLFLSSSGT
jgi:hypothetical protein